MKKITITILSSIILLTCIVCPTNINNIKNANAYTSSSNLPSCDSKKVTYDESGSRCRSPYYYSVPYVYVSVWSSSRKITFSPDFLTTINSVSSYSTSLKCYKYLKYCKINNNGAGSATISFMTDRGWHYDHHGYLVKNGDELFTKTVSWSAIDTAPHQTSSTEALTIYNAILGMFPNTKKVVKLLKAQIKSISKNKSINEVDTITCNNNKQKTFDIAKYLKIDSQNKVDNYILNHLCLISGFKRVDVHYINNGKENKKKKVVIKY